MEINTNINLISTLLLLAGIAGIFLSILLLRKKNNYANRFLAVFIFSVAITVIHHYLIDTNTIYYVPILIAIILPLEFIFPPALYLYVRIMTDKTNTIKKYQLHFLPALIGIILLIPFYQLDFITKLTIIQNHFNQSLLPGLFHSTFPIFVTTTTIQALVYTVLIFKLLFFHHHKVAHYYSYRKNNTLSWLRNFMVVLVVFWLIASIVNYFYKQNTVPFNIDQLLYIFSAIAIIYIAIMGLRQP
ncbi:hypothetical protein MNBD_GAMMA22-220 [hydrothermal vent metagenome]|uniref:Histidine kinase N-terminal 7TM region domain-containing protein n=1 Tax=hydrothermal vent metagenome TaxID=652676 RepID=A0A3B0ZP08_9ZZZZ